MCLDYGIVDLFLSIFHSKSYRYQSFHGSRTNFPFTESNLPDTSSCCTFYAFITMIYLLSWTTNDFYFLQTRGSVDQYYLSRYFVSVYSSPQSRESKLMTRISISLIKKIKRKNFLNR